MRDMSVHTKCGITAHALVQNAAVALVPCEPSGDAAALVGSILHASALSASAGGGWRWWPDATRHDGLRLDAHRTYIS